MFCQDTERKTAAKLRRRSESSRGRARASQGGDGSECDGSGSVPLMQPEDAEENTQQGAGGRRTENLPVTKLAHLHFFEARATSTPLFVSFLDGAAVLSSLSPLPSLFIAMSLLQRSGPPRDRGGPGPRGGEAGQPHDCSKSRRRSVCHPRAAAKPAAKPPRGWMHEQGGQGAGRGGIPGNAREIVAMAGSSCGQVTPFLAAGSCFTQSKMGKCELLLKQPRVSDGTRAPCLCHAASGRRLSVLGDACAASCRGL